GGGGGKDKERAPDNAIVVQILRAFEKHSGKSMDDVVAFAEKPPASEEPQSADLSTKSLQDLLGRESRKQKQIDASRERVKEAEAALEAARKFAEEQIAQLAVHEGNLKNIKAAITARQAEAVIPDQSKVGDINSGIELLENFGKMLDAMGAHFGVDVAGMAKETAAKLEEQKQKAAEAASAAKHGGMDVDVECDPADPAIQACLKEAGVDIDDPAKAKSWSSAQTLLEWAHDSADQALPDVLCLQEHRIKSGPLLESAVRWASKRTYYMYARKAESTGDGPLQSSGGVSVLSRLAASREPQILGQLLLPSHRVESVRLNVGLAVPLHVVSLHLVTSVGLAKQTIDILTQLMEYLGSLPGPWIVLGDFNMLPEEVQEWALRAQAILWTT
ncbi:unnamed protein product, partial [Prorocentrum cordatum]